MYYRMNLQPQSMEDYELIDIYGNTYIGQWLVGSNYEGWYIKAGLSCDPKPGVYSQKEIKIYGYRPVGSDKDYKNYISKKLLDEAFYGHTHISDFRETPAIMSYLR